MDFQHHLSLEDVAKAVQMVGILSARFRIPVPQVRVIDGFGAYCVPAAHPNGMIKIGLWRAPQGTELYSDLEDTVVHEFAHIVDVRRNVGKRGHDLKYFKIVDEVSRSWYGRPDRYQWKFEYATGRLYARRAGLLEGGA